MRVEGTPRSSASTASAARRPDTRAPWMRRRVAVVAADVEPGLEADRSCGTGPSAAPATAGPPARRTSRRAPSGAVSTPYSRARWARTAGSAASPLTTELDTRCRPGAYDGAALVSTTVLATGPLRSPSSTIAGSAHRRLGRQVVVRDDAALRRHVEPGQQHAGVRGGGRDDDRPRAQHAARPRRRCAARRARRGRAAARRARPRAARGCACMPARRDALRAADERAPDQVEEAAGGVEPVLEEHPGQERPEEAVDHRVGQPAGAQGVVRRRLRGATAARRATAAPAGGGERRR